jgi:hypothetical protein
MPAPPQTSLVISKTAVAKTPEPEGKTPVITPILGSWADDCCWNSRQASEIINDGAQDKKDPECAEPASDMQGSQSMEVHHSEQEAIPQWQLDQAHVTRCISFNPYNIVDPCVIHHYCECTQCMEMYQHCEQDMALQNSSPPQPPKAVQPSSPFETHAGHHRSQRHAELWDVDELQPSVSKPSALPTVFMPPPPPPRLTPIMLRQEGCPDAETIHANILLRWYDKLSRVQMYFVTADDLCPPPPSAHQQYLFDGWCEMVGAWWFSHFEHMQKKQRPYFTQGQYECYY